MEQEERNEIKQQGVALAAKMIFFAGLVQFPALTTQIFLRRKLGFRIVSIFKLLTLTSIMLVISVLAGTLLPEHYRNTAWTLAVFAVVMFILGAINRRMRWNEIKRGTVWHTYSRGIPILSFLPLSETAIKRFVEPVLLLIIGAVLVFFLPMLGYWILLTAACVAIFEAYDYDVRRFGAC